MAIVIGCQRGVSELLRALFDHKDQLEGKLKHRAIPQSNLQTTNSSNVSALE